MNPFTKKAIPELELCRSDFERREALGRARGKPGFDPLLILWMLFIISVAVGAWLFTSTFRPHWMNQTTTIVIRFAVLALAVPASWVSMWIVSSRQRRVVRGYLIELGVPVCQHCGYDLAGVSANTEVCPECGHALGERERALVSEPSNE